jgi:uncharacterized membrane protein
VINFISELLRGRIFGHPVHMMLVHFPSAFFPMSAILDIISVYLRDNSLAVFSFYSLTAGAVMGWLALTFGIVELLKINPRSNAFVKAITHGGLNLIWMLAFSVISWSELKDYPNINIPSNVEILIKIFALSGMLYSNFLGGELVLKYDVGKQTKVHNGEKEKK